MQQCSAQMSALNKAVTKKASKRRAEQRRDREAPYTLAPPDTARAVAKALPALRKMDIIVGLNALTRRLERDGVQGGCSRVAGVKLR